MSADIHVYIFSRLHIHTDIDTVDIVHIDIGAAIDAGVNIGIEMDIHIMFHLSHVIFHI